jgi:hypothetical protein
MLAGAGCLVGGAAAAAVLRKPFWFAAGALIGASVVGYRVFNNYEMATDPEMLALRNPQAAAAVQQETQTFRAHPEWREQLGGPEMPQEDQAPITAAGSPVRWDDVRGSGYPLMHRIPDADVRIDSMDPFIAPHFTGPLGPSNDPVRHWQ